MKKKTSKQYRLTLNSGEKITIQAIPRDGYRLVSTLDDIPEQPEMPYQSNYFPYDDDWIVDPDDEHPGYLHAMELYDEHVKMLMARQQYETTLYVINNGLVEEPTKEEVRLIYVDDYAQSADEIKFLWLFNKCSNEEEFLDIVDAIVGINMPTESGVQSVIRSFQTMIVDNDIIVPLTNWESEKERKGGVMMSLYAEGLMACAQLNGIITLEKYLSLPGDPRYADENSDFPLSMSHLIAMNRANNTSQSAVQEIEMRDDGPKDDDGEEWLRKGRHQE